MDGLMDDIFFVIETYIKTKNEAKTSIFAR